MKKTSEPPLAGTFTAQVEGQIIQGRTAGEGENTLVLLTGLGVPALLWHELGDRAGDVENLIQGPP